uniref:ATP synthase complex subunit 8 n=1 Tax=Gastroptychus rogeri TaxID=989316 RepID=A0A3S6JBB3_9EUCA|nr:ATP synthase F0 subunit 8 [Gastroptychus rogeri]
MPQMAPLLWFNLMLLFTFCFFFYIIMNYFMLKHSQIKNQKMSPMNSEKNWQW